MRLLALSGLLIIRTEMTDSLPFHMLQIMKSLYSWSLWKEPLSCVPPRGAVLKETILYSKKHGTEWLIYCLVSSCKNNSKIYVNYIHISSENSSPSINRLPRIIASPSPLLSSSLFLFIPSLSRVTGIWSSTETDQWRFKPWKLIKELNLEHLKKPMFSLLDMKFFDLMA